MGLFDIIEKGISKGATVVGEALQKAAEASDGWGQKADEWIADEQKYEKVKEVFTDLTDKATEFFEKTVDGSPREDDIVHPERVPTEETAAPAPAPAPVQEETPAPAAEKPVKEETVTASVVPEEAVVPLVATEKLKTKTKAKANKTVAELRAEAKDLGIKGVSKLNKEELTKAIKNAKRKK